MLSTHLIDEVANLLEHVLLIDDGRLIIDQDADELRDAATDVSGTRSAADAFVVGRTVLHRTALGGLATATISELDATGRAVPLQSRRSPDSWCCAGRPPRPERTGAGAPSDGGRRDGIFVVMNAVTLRPLRDGDFDAVFALESDVMGADMIALLPRVPGDRAGFELHWQRIRGDASVVARVIEADGVFAGYAISFPLNGERQIGYWVERELWGRGIAGEALRLLLAELPERPLWARVARSNVASRRVLEREGFGMVATERVLAPRRGVVVDELVLRLD